MRLPILAPPPAPPPDVALSGIILGGRASVAIVKGATDVSPIRVTLGSQVAGWTVSAINARGLVLRQGDRIATIALPEPVR